MEKRAAKWLVELQNKAVRLDREVFGVQQPALGPFQRRLQEIGGIEPLVFGQYGELSESFEGLIDTLAVKGCDQAADHYLLDVGPGAASVQKRLPPPAACELLCRSRSGWRASSSPQVRPPGVGSGGEAPDGLTGASRSTGGTGACLLGRGPLGGVALPVLPALGPTPAEVGRVAGVRVRGGLRGRGCRLGV